MINKYLLLLASLGVFTASTQADDNLRRVPMYRRSNTGPGIKNEPMTFDNGVVCNMNYIYILSI